MSSATFKHYEQTLQDFGKAQLIDHLVLGLVPRRPLYCTSVADFDVDAAMREALQLRPCIDLGASALQVAA